MSIPSNNSAPDLGAMLGLGYGGAGDADAGQAAATTPETAPETNVEQGAGSDTDTATANEQAQEQQVQDESAAARTYAGKYKTPEDLERAYQEAQKKLTQQAQELARFKLSPQHTPDTQPQVKPDQAAQPQIDATEFWSRATNDPAGVIGQLAEQKAQQMIAPIMQHLMPSMQDQQMTQIIAAAKTVAADAYPDLDTLAPQIAEMRKSVPFFSNQPITPELFDALYQVASAQAIAKNAAQTAQTAVQAAQTTAQDAARQALTKAGVQTNKAAKAPAPAKTAEQEILDSILGAGGSTRFF